MNSKKAPEGLQTQWYDDVTTETPWNEYPRPQMVRKDWKCLNGLWDYAIRPKKVTKIERFDGKILVPYPIESALSRVKKPLSPTQHLWYRKTFSVPEDWVGHKVLLHFGGVDWKTIVVVNGVEVGTHIGGYNPFSFDITTALDLKNENEIIVKVYDPTDKERIPAGKQKRKPLVVFYTPNSGIWQTVWIEAVPQIYINKLKLTPNIDSSEINVNIKTNIGEQVQKFSTRVKILGEGVTVAEKEDSVKSPLNIKIPQPQLWSPENPYLYDLEIELLNQGQTLDKVKSYFGMRKFSLEKDENGKYRFYLNNKPYFMMGTLDQGYWPDGIYTAPTDEALRWDIEMTKKFGFNMIRKHIKVEPLRWYYHCDKLGMIVWQDMPSPSFSPKYFLLKWSARILKFKVEDSKKYRRVGLKDPRYRKYLEKELKEMIDTHYNVPSIAIWVPFNEMWGQFDAKRIGDWTIKYDPTRLVDHTSGFFDQGGSHFISKHNYADTFKMPENSGNRGVVLSETGGYTMKIPEHSWNPKKKFGYKTFNSKEQLHSAFENMVDNVLTPAITDGLSGVVYTQTTDVEIEYNGLITYDRKILKMDPEIIKPMIMKLYKGNR